MGTLSEEEKSEFLIRLGAEGESGLRAELLRRFATGAGQRTEKARTVGELLALGRLCQERRRAQEAAEAARETARLQRIAAVARRKQLDALAPRAAEAWAEIDGHIASRLPKRYDAAVALLVNLLELATRQGSPAAAKARIACLAEEHAQKRTLIERLRKAGLSI